MGWLSQIVSQICFLHYCILASYVFISASSSLTFFYYLYSHPTIQWLPLLKTQIKHSITRRGLANDPYDVVIVVLSLSYLTFCDPMDCSASGFPVRHCLLELAQTHVHWFSDAIQPSHPLSSPFPPALSLSQHQGLFQWVDSSHQVSRELELQLQHQSFQWIFRVEALS